jgi:hypothetical protein
VTAPRDSAGKYANFEVFFEVGFLFALDTPTKQDHCSVICRDTCAWDAQ